MIIPHSHSHPHLTAGSPSRQDLDLQERRPSLRFRIEKCTLHRHVFWVEAESDERAQPAAMDMEHNSRRRHSSSSRFSRARSRPRDLRFPEIQEASSAQRPLSPRRIDSAGRRSRNPRTRSRQKRRSRSALIHEILENPG
jgi:hypothetical protein